MKCTSNDENTRQKTRRFRILIAVGFILVVIPVVSLLLDPQYQLMIYMTRVSNGSKIYDRFLIENAGTLVQVYVFNITNAEAFLSGEDHKLRVEEVGPFTYQEYRKNEEFQLDEEAGVIRYRPIIRTKFLREMSIDDPELVNVTVPNAAMLAITSMLNSYPYFTKIGFNILANRLKSKPIVDTSVQEYLWGYDEPLIALCNTLLPGWITFSKMGILDRLYDQSSSPLMEVSITPADKFQVKKIDDCPGLKAWNYDNPSKRTRCNSFVDAYEGYAYPPKLTRDDQLRLYRSTFCRMINLDYIGTKKTDISPEAFVYEISNKSYSIDPSTECLCGLEEECIDGISNISPCLFGLSIGLSNAHFLHANPEVYARVEGIHPSKEKHGSEFIVDPDSGAVLGGRFTLQASVIVKDASFVPKVEPFSNMVVPLVYFKIVQPELPDEDKNNIRISNYILPYVLHGLEVTLFIIGSLILAYTLYQTSIQCIYSRLQKKNENNTTNNRVVTPLMEKLNDFEIKESQLEIYSLDS